MRGQHRWRRFGGGAAVVFWLWIEPMACRIGSFRSFFGFRRASTARSEASREPGGLQSCFDESTSTRSRGTSISHSISVTLLPTERLARTIGINAARRSA